MGANTTAPVRERVHLQTSAGQHIEAAERALAEAAEHLEAAMPMLTPFHRGAAEGVTFDVGFSVRRLRALRSHLRPG